MYAHKNSQALTVSTRGAVFNKSPHFDSHFAYLWRLHSSAYKQMTLHVFYLGAADGRVISRGLSADSLKIASRRVTWRHVQMYCMMGRRLRVT